MFESIIKHLDQDVEIDEQELATPVTFDVLGDVVTVKGLVSLEEPMKGSRTVRATWAPAESASPREVGDLDRDEVRRLAIETVRSAPKDLALGSIGRGSFSTDDLEREIEQGTEVGERFVEAVRDHSIFLQEAVRAGRVSVRSEPRSVDLPEFDF